MGPIIIEGVLFVALVAAVGALLYWGALYFTPLGRRVRETRNRVAIERAAELECPLHGQFADGELVRLPGGARMCPVCYREVARGSGGG
ncbi:MAG: hypothetical protein ACJ79S_17955 [Gemmatimonadaceae bacterium]